MAFVQVNKSSTISWAQYEQIAREWFGDNPLDGLLFRVAGTDGDGVYLIEGWESRAACDRALEKFLPIASKLGLSENDIVTEEFELRDQMFAGQLSISR